MNSKSAIQSSWVPNDDLTYSNSPTSNLSIEDSLSFSVRRLSNDETTHISKSSLDFCSDDSFASSRKTKKISPSINITPIKDNARVQELSINKLRYDSVVFVGREAESKILRSRLRRAAINAADIKEHFRSQKELVFIKGWSGVGKSCLTNRLKGWTNELEKGLFVTGKFDLTSKTPYSGIAQAIGKVCQEAERKVGGKKLGNRLVSELRPEGHLIIKKIIPELRNILPKEAEENASMEDGNGFEAGMERWKHVFRVLVRILGSYFSPLVIVLDDLQWVDIASLSILDMLLTDSQNINGLLIIGCYRSNEVDDTHILSKKMSMCGEETEKGLFNITEIELGNLSLRDTNKIIMALLDIDDEAMTTALAEVCYKRTLGNPFFLIEFVTMLEAEGLISFSLGTFKWEWNVQAVEESTMSTKNVVELLQDRMKKLPKDFQLLLQFAANLGASFHHGLLQPVWSFHSSNTSTNKEKSDLQSMYDELARNLYIDRLPGNRFHWVHDKIQEAALYLGKASNPSFQFEVGSILFVHLGEDELEQSLFDIVDLINKGSIHDPSRRLDFCMLNLRAAEKAQSLSAFDSSSRYVSAGIKLLPPDKWALSHRALTLRLYAIGSEMALATGNVERMDLYADEVLGRQDFTTVEKLPLYRTVIYRQSTVDIDHERSLKLCSMVLKDLGCTVVKNRALAAVQSLKRLAKIFRSARKEKRDYAQSLPLMTDERQLAIMTLLNQTQYSALMTGNLSIAMAIATQMYDLTLEHGISPEAGPTFATLSMVVATGLKDYDTAVFFAESAIKAQQKTGSKYNEACTLFMTGFAAMTWRKPLQDCSKLMLEAYIGMSHLFRLAQCYLCESYLIGTIGDVVYSVGMQSGHTTYGLWGLLMHSTIFPFVLGKPLGAVLLAGAQNIPLMEEAKQEAQTHANRLFCQAIANLTGKSEHTTLLQGNFFASVGWEPPAQFEPDFNFLRMALAVYFGDFEVAADIVFSPGTSFEKKASGVFMVPPEVFLSGVALYAMARKTKKWRYKRAAKQTLAKMDRWFQSGNPNVHAYYYMLQAEQAASRNNHKDAESFYKEAVVAAARTGQLHVAGLSSERYADFLLTEKKDLEESLYQKEQAIRFYLAWGANAVVERIRDSMTSGRTQEKTKKEAGMHKSFRLQTSVLPQTRVYIQHRS